MRNLLHSSPTRLLRLKSEWSRRDASVRPITVGHFVLAILLLAALPVPVQAEIIREEAVKHFDGDLAVTTMPPIGGGTDQTYVLVISTESNSDVTNVRDTLDELSWVERKEQCTVSNGESGIRLWTAQGLSLIHI